MYFTNYIRHDGYYESLCSLREGLGPILKCRVISCLDGSHEVIVRDHSTGKMVSSRRWDKSLKRSKEMAKQQAIAFIKGEMIDI